MGKYVGATGLQYLWGKISAVFAKKADMPQYVICTLSEYEGMASHGSGTDYIVLDGDTPLINIMKGDMQRWPVYKSLTLKNNTLSLTSGSFGSLSSTENLTRIAAAKGDGNSLVPIMIPKNGKIRIKGLKGIDGQKTALRFDFVYYNTNAALSSSQGSAVGTYSNFVSANYFPLNASGESNEVDFQNTYGQDYYFALSMRGTNNGNVLVENYNIEYIIIR